MSDNKTQPTEVSVDEFLDGIPNEEKRRNCQHLRTLMESATGHQARMWGPSIVGFGQVHYRYESGREGDMPAVGFAPRSAAITLYITGGFDSVGQILDRLGTFKTGKGCLYLKRLSDVDESALIDLIQASVIRASEIHVAN